MHYKFLRTSFDKKIYIQEGKKSKHPPKNKTEKKILNQRYANDFLKQNKKNNKTCQQQNILSYKQQSATQKQEKLETTYKNPDKNSIFKQKRLKINQRIELEQI
eukprot:TRINITY_DN3673_c0_g1_i10.p5 TRINITY_DN3673_c0_g1~~TRINITY_DN3673_c0_g1_i10.p5  ORF type:complete len:104 (+),score=4.37 TRINITY_DN3673_c0_g1_i10:1010-1321(+)